MAPIERGGHIALATCGTGVACWLPVNAHSMSLESLEAGKTLATVAAQDTLKDKV